MEYHQATAGNFSKYFEISSNLGNYLGNDMRWRVVCVQRTRPLGYCGNPLITMILNQCKNIQESYGYI